MSLIQSRISARCLSFGSCLASRARPSLEKALVFVSFSQSLKRSISRSTAFLALTKSFLSLMSALPILQQMHGDQSWLCIMNAPDECLVQGQQTCLETSPCLDLVPVTLQLFDFLFEVCLILFLLSWVDASVKVFALHQTPRMESSNVELCIADNLCCQQYTNLFPDLVEYVDPLAHSLQSPVDFSLKLSVGPHAGELRPAA